MSRVPTVAERWIARHATLHALVPRSLVLLLGYELGLFGSLWRWARRVPDVPPGGVAIHYGADLRPLMWAVFVLSIVEIGVVDLVVPWRTARLVLLVAGVYGALWMLGFISALGVRPHVVTADLLRLRFAQFREIAVPLDLVDTVRAGRHSGYRRSLQVEDGVLAMTVSDSTTVSVRLREPWSTRLKPGAAEQTVTEVRFHADDPRAAVAALTS